MKFLSSKLFLFLSGLFLFQSCGSYKIYTGSINYDASINNEVVKSAEMSSYIESKDKIKFVLRAPAGFENYSEKEQFEMNEIFGQIEKELIKNGHIVKDRVLLDLMLDKGDMSLTEVGKTIDTDIIVEIIDIAFDITNPIKDFKIKEKGVNTNFDNFNNIEFIDCQLTMMQCRITLVDEGNVGGIFSFYISGCDRNSDFYIKVFEEYSGSLNGEKDTFVGWNYGNVSFKSLTHTYDMNEMSRQKAIEKLVKVLLKELVPKSS